MKGKLYFIKQIVKSVLATQVCKVLSHMRPAGGGSRGASVVCVSGRPRVCARHMAAPSHGEQHFLRARPQVCLVAGLEVMHPSVI